VLGGVVFGRVFVVRVWVFVCECVWWISRNGRLRGGVADLGDFVALRVARMLGLFASLGLIPLDGHGWLVVAVE
jgi:hypothetical protein